MKEKLVAIEPRGRGWFHIFGDIEGSADLPVASVPQEQSSNSDTPIRQRSKSKPKAPVQQGVKRKISGVKEFDNVEAANVGSSGRKRKDKKSSSGRGIRSRVG